VPNAEVLLFDELDAWIFSAGNPGHGYGEKHAEIVNDTLLRAIERAGSFRSPQIPAESEGIMTSREKVINGAHELAEADNDLALLVTRLAAAANGDEGNLGKPAAQAY